MSGGTGDENLQIGKPGTPTASALWRVSSGRCAVIGRVVAVCTSGCSRAHHDNGEAVGGGEGVRRGFLKNERAKILQRSCRRPIAERVALRARRATLRTGDRGKSGDGEGCAAVRMNLKQQRLWRDRSTPAHAACCGRYRGGVRALCQVERWACGCRGGVFGVAADPFGVCATNLHAKL
eukprot:ctg_5157.g509